MFDVPFVDCQSSSERRMRCPTHCSFSNIQVTGRARSGSRRKDRGSDVITPREWKRCAQASSQWHPSLSAPSKQSSVHRLSSILLCNNSRTKRTKSTTLFEFPVYGGDTHGHSVTWQIPPSPVVIAVTNHHMAEVDRYLTALPTAKILMSHCRTGSPRSRD